MIFATFFIDQRAFQTGTFSKENGKTSHRRLQTLRCEVCLTDRQSGRNLWSFWL